MTKYFLIIILIVSTGLYNLSGIVQYDKNFRTDFSKSSIDIDDVLSGGPGKDGIPAINNPKFISMVKADLKDDALGILVKVDKETRYYPFNILVWHEIVNDNIGKVYFSVTFCPLCGSAIAFNRKIGGKVHRFGVSGYLYESNLLMYDNKTESFWSQSRGEAVIGKYLGKKLEILDIDILSFKEVKKYYPDSRILSKETGYRRNYSVYPYGDYEVSSSLFFPVSKSDSKYHAKEVMYAFRYKGIPYVFPLNKFKSDKFVYKNKNLTITITRNSKGGIDITINNEVIPGYYEMWFSWLVHNYDRGIVIDSIY